MRWCRFCTSRIKISPSCLSAPVNNVQFFRRQDIGAVAKAWEDSPYLFIVKVQPLLRGVEDEDVGAEQLGFSFTSQNLPVQNREESWRISTPEPVLFSLQ